MVEILPRIPAARNLNKTCPGSNVGYSMLCSAVGGWWLSRGAGEPSRCEETAGVLGGDGEYEDIAAG